MSKELAQIIVFSGGVAVLAGVDTGDRRTSEVVNEGGNHLLVEQPRFVRGEPLELVVTAANGLIRKSATDAVLVLSEPAAPAERRLASYIVKTPMRVAMLLPDMAIVGTVHVLKRQDPVRLVLDGPEPFAVLTDAIVTPVRGPARNAPVVLVNRARLVAAAVAK